MPVYPLPHSHPVRGGACASCCACLPLAMSDAKLAYFKGSRRRRVHTASAASAAGKGRHSSAAAAAAPPLHTEVAHLLSCRDTVVLVTGAGQGIGRSIALLFAKAGASLVITDLVKEKVEETGSLISEVENNGGFLALQQDVRKQADAVRVVREAVRVFGRVDVLINNAGIFPRDNFDTFDGERWDQIFAVNCKGLIYMTQAVAKVMIAYQKQQQQQQTAGSSSSSPPQASRSPCIVNVSSVAGERANPMLFSYSASKAAVTNLTASLAMHLAKSNIRVNAVCPGVVSSDGAVESLPSELLSKLGALNPLGGRNITPEEVASAVFFLASPMASFVTGTTVRVDGGAMAKL